MNVIDCINLAGIVAVFGFVCALAKYLIQDIKQLSKRVAQIGDFFKCEFRKLFYDEIMHATPQLLAGSPHPMASVMRDPSGSQDCRSYEQAYMTKFKLPTGAKWFGGL